MLKFKYYFIIHFGFSDMEAEAGIEPALTALQAAA
jgi:hypothetical protein